MQVTLKAARQFAGISGKKMSATLNIGYDKWRKIEKDPTKASVEQLQKISELTGVPLGSLFLGSEATNVANAVEKSTAQINI
jgi:transcriptional regulator with XRE-family HTH domain